LTKTVDKLFVEFIGEIVLGSEKDYASLGD
jgi:hypothetical protein